MKHPTCQHGMHEKPRCRKRAAFAIQYLVPFGYRICMSGKVEQFLPRITLRCADHDKVEREEARLPIAEHLASIAILRQAGQE